MKIIFLLPLVFLNLINAQNYLKLTDLGQKQYQDIVINGEIYKKGIRECSQRFDALEKILQQYKRPIKILDIGASQGYFSFMTAYKYNATCIMIEGNYKHCSNVADQLEDLCKINNKIDNIIFLKKHFSEADLEQLACDEHFDVVLAFSVLHHFKDWKRATKAVLSLGDNIIIETPPADGGTAKKNKSVAPLEKYLLEKNGTILCTVPRQNPKHRAKMFWFSNSRKFSIYTEKLTQNKIQYEIVSTFFEKYLFDPINEVKASYNNRGILNSTFKAFNGVFPQEESAIFSHLILDTFF